MEVGSLHETKCPFHDLGAWGREHVNEQWLATYIGGCSRAVNLVQSCGLGVVHQYQTDEDKMFIHYISKQLIDDLWRFATPRLQGFIRPDSRFDLQELFQTTKSEVELGEDIQDNLDRVSRLIGDVHEAICDDWVSGLKERYKLGFNADPLPLMWVAYKLHAAMILGGDMDSQSILTRTFCAGGPEVFYWLRDYPDMTREELETIVYNSRTINSDLGHQLTVHSTARGDVAFAATERGELPYILAGEGTRRKIIFDPSLTPAVQARIEEINANNFFDPTDLLLGCPGIAVISNLYPNAQSMLNHFFLFRASAYVEAFLGRKAAFGVRNEPAKNLEAHGL